MSFDYADDHVTPGDFTEQFRFPIVTTPYPRWAYITAVVVAEQSWMSSVRPTDDELRIVASFHEEYCAYWYGPAGTGYRVTMSKYPFDIDGGANTRILVKRDEGDWAYRMRTWTQGPPLIPAVHMGQEKLDLIPLLDHIQTTCGEPRPHWVEWKTAHPEVFTAVTS